MLVLGYEIPVYEQVNQVTVLPKLTQLQRIDRLIGSTEMGDILRIHTAIRVRDQLDGQLVDAGEALQRP